jgi:hypothetical protein
MSLSRPELDAKYRRLGFKPAALGLELVIGNVQLSAAEHTWRGVVVIFTCVTPRRMVQFDVGVPFKCSVEQIAALLYMNFASNFREDADALKAHLQSNGIHLFQ